MAETTAAEDPGLAEAAEDEIEPMLTYTRLYGDVPGIMKQEAVSCMAVHDKFFVLGTHSGKVFILDISGDICSNGRIASHRSAINQISIDQRADFIGSCSDHRVIISELYSAGPDSELYSNGHERPVKAMAIDPQFSAGKRFVVGEADRLLLYERNLIGRYKPTCLQDSRGLIRQIGWRANFIVCATDLCMKIYDCQARRMITHLDRDKESGDYRLRLDLYQCAFTWKDDRTLLVAWGHTVRVCQIKQRDSPSLVAAGGVAPQTEPPAYYVELVYSFNIGGELVACGAAPFDGRRLLILCTDKWLLHPSMASSGGGGRQPTPSADRAAARIKMVEPKNAERFADVSDDILVPNDFAKTVQRSRDASLHVSGPEEAGAGSLYLILCPKDLIVAKPRLEDDSIEWLLRRRRFGQALDRVRANASKCHRHTVETVAKAYVRNLLEQRTPESRERAAQICHDQLCGPRPELWPEQLELFREYHCLRVLAKYVPGCSLERRRSSGGGGGGGPARMLDGLLYEMILAEFLEFDSAGFLQLVRQLAPGLYSTGSLIKSTTNKLSAQPQDRNLLEALAELHTHEGRYHKALFIFLQVGNAEKVFELIGKHQLGHLLEDRIVELLQLDPEKTSRLLILNQETIPPDKVVARLRKQPQLLCAYLDRLMCREPAACAPYHDLLFDLYARYQPERIVPFLRQSNCVQLDKALEVCRKEGLAKAVVYILGRMGNTHEALRIIIDQMDDINLAIEFCKEHADSELWAELLDISVSRPRLLATLLRELGTYAADPIGLIARIPEGLEVPSLVPSLVKILQDYRLMVTLEQGCRRVLNADCYHLFRKAFRVRSRAVAVRDSDRYCHSCQLHSDAAGAEYVLFQCGHLFHSSCLPLEQRPSCTLCQTKNGRTSADNAIIPSAGSADLYAI